MSFAIRRLSAMTARRRKACYGLAALLAILLMGGAQGVYNAFSESAEPAATYIIDRGDIEKTVLATGILKPSVQVNVGAQVNGQLKKLYVRVGERVTQGQLLAEIDPTLQQSELRKSEAALESAVSQKQASQFTLTQYELELKRQLRMDRDGSGTKSNLEEAQARVDTQKAQVRVNMAQIVQAQMALETAKANLGYTRILAPVDGQVLGIVTKEGQTVVSSQTAPTILVLANVDTMTVQTRISETDILKVHPGQPLWFYVVAEPKRRYRSVMGVLQDAPNDALQDDSARPQGQQASAVYYNGVFSVPNPEHRLRTSMTAQVFIITDRAKNVLRLPVVALGQPQGANSYHVQVLNGDKAEQRLIQVGINDRQFVEVKAGLNEGDRVVIAHNDTGTTNG
ncbi:efflux RND transporter periplasmic adaptor subunit [Klebsiella michiganensis]|uniref:efflux RND transporter periplasmic adaptor subunit n=2 Tax=Klebsiella/Raoultella group TaxID=2890311 RepID=UPI0006E529CB|nr:MULTISPECIES: efflux RND transporter periplasmic adaptor subunit [Klebsiella]EKW0784928.1 efflux RND transporter periplasmic adaptor subunit [Klebsiella michiganensis]MDX6056512.1 efflux RND transporter periplasmic adaptor subunit [Klebsiella sp. JN_Kp126]OEG84212.1 efflux transporter periplasmic adaptor subunit [Klebsiella michiganensis]